MAQPKNVVRESPVASPPEHPRVVAHVAPEAPEGGRRGARK
jgi:hypothetical protein